MTTIYNNRNTINTNTSISILYNSTSNIDTTLSTITGDDNSVNNLTKSYGPDKDGYSLLIFTVSSNKVGTVKYTFSTKTVSIQYIEPPEWTSGPLKCPDKPGVEVKTSIKINKIFDNFSSNSSPLQLYSNYNKYVTSNILPYTFPSGISGIIQLYIYVMCIQCSISPSRICNLISISDITPENITYDSSISIIFNVTDSIDTTLTPNLLKLFNLNTIITNPSTSNDNLSNTCVGNWLNNIISSPTFTIMDIMRPIIYKGDNNCVFPTPFVIQHFTSNSKNNLIETITNTVTPVTNASASNTTFLAKLPGAPAAAPVAAPIAAPIAANKCNYMDNCSSPGVWITYTLNSRDLNLNDSQFYGLYSTEWINFPGYTTGSIVPASNITPQITAPCNIPSGFIGAMYGGLIPLTLGFNISPSRICGLNITTTPADLTTATILSSITYKFKLTDTNLQSPPLVNDYLPAGILNQWIVDWLSAFSFATNNSPPPVEIPEKYLTREFKPLYSHFTSSILYKQNYNINNIEKYSGVSTTVDPGYSMVDQPSQTQSHSPSSIFDYLFYFAYPISFAGAIFYGLVSVVQIDPSTIIVNRNVAIILNIYIGICAIISIFIWYNLNISIFNNINYNLKSSKISLYK